jgi:hypothetical protein
MKSPGGDGPGILISEDFEPLTEAVVSPDGTIPVCLIRAGWSKNRRFYRDRVLQEAAHIYKKGTHNLWNHPGPTSIREQPSGDLNAIASVLSEDARYDPVGPINPKTGKPNGPGLYARVKPISTYRDRILSHRVRGREVAGTAEGRTGKIVEEIYDPAKYGLPPVTVDWVARPAAGGSVLVEEEEMHMVDEEITNFEEAIAERDARITTLEEAHAAAEATIAEHMTTIAGFRAKEILAESIAAAKLDEAVEARVRAIVAGTALPMTDDHALDEAAYTAAVSETVEAEKSYAATIAEAARAAPVGVPGGSGSTGAVGDFLDRTGGIRAPRRG